MWFANNLKTVVRPQHRSHQYNDWAVISTDIHYKYVQTFDLISYHWLLMCATLRLLVSYCSHPYCTPIKLMYNMFVQSLSPSVHLLRRSAGQSVPTWERLCSLALETSSMGMSDAEMAVLDDYGGHTVTPHRWLKTSEHFPHPHSAGNPMRNFEKLFVSRDNFIIGCVHSSGKSSQSRHL